MCGILASYSALIAVAVFLPSATCSASQRQTAQEQVPPNIDDDQLEANGIRKSAGKHLTLYTDVRDRADIDQFTEVFDQAVPQWCALFGIDPAKAESWHQDASVMLEPDRFRRAGLVPIDVPAFLAGYQRGDHIWVYIQSGDYYTRHLLLHEGTHGFMAQFLGGLGAPWYAEGMAELVGLNQWRDNRLAIAHTVTDRDEVPYWGRVLLIRQAVQRGELKSLADVFATPGSAFRQVESYAWAWAACEFLSRHPISAKTFADLIHHCGDDREIFNRRLTDPLQAQWPKLEFEWRQFLLEIDYGSDVERAALYIVGGSKDKIELAVDRGWQVMPVTVAKGKPLSISAAGEFQIARDQEAWPCRANGVTIEYYRGRPLGRLIAAILPATPENPSSQDYPRELQIVDVGERATIVPEFDGRLLLRINESPAHWQDNEGSLTVTVE